MWAYACRDMWDAWSFGDEDDEEDNNSSNNNEQESKDKNQKVMFDAGHGGKDSGVPKQKGKRHEKEINLQVVKYLEELLSKYDVEIYQTRTGDVYVSISDRKKKANELGVNAFVSVHVNSAGNPKADYIGVYTRKNADANTLNLAENISAYLAWFGSSKQGTKVISTNERMGVIRGHNKGTAAVLVEIGFMTNPRQENLMQKDSYLYKVAQGIANGVLLHLYQTAPE